MRYLLVLATLLAFASCSQNDGPSVDPRHKEVQEYAVQCSQYLVDGDAEQYAQCISDYATLPMEYRTQMLDLHKQFIDKVQTEHNGIVSIRAVGDSLLSDSTADAFIEYTFGDSTHEQVSVPLVLTEDGWRLK